MLIENKPLILSESPFFTAKVIPPEGTLCPLTDAVPLTIFPVILSEASVVDIWQEAVTPKNKGFEID